MAFYCRKKGFTIEKQLLKSHQIQQGNQQHTIPQSAIAKTLYFRQDTHMESQDSLRMDNNFVTYLQPAELPSSICRFKSAISAKYSDSFEANCS